MNSAASVSLIEVSMLTFEIEVTGRFVQNCTLTGMRITFAFRRDFEREF
jgi:hypothetical protein